MATENFLRSQYDSYIVSKAELFLDHCAIIYNKHNKPPTKPNTQFLGEGVEGIKLGIFMLPSKILGYNGKIEF